MMRKHMLVIATIFLITTIVLVTFLKNKVGDVRPAVLPPARLESPAQKTRELARKLDGPLKLPDGFEIGLFAEEVPGVRDLVFSPGGTLVASLTASGRVVALPDRDGDGAAEKIVTLLDRLDKPHGLAFFSRGDDIYLFVSEETKVVRYIFSEEDLTARRDKKLVDLPTGGRHFTRTIAIRKDGTLYVSIGSTCDTCFEKNPFLAAVIKSDIDGAAPKLFAKGLRNAVFITLHPSTGELWGGEMGRDFLGDDLPPDEINIIRGPSILRQAQDPGQIPSTVFDYGWPVCYGNKVYDEKFGERSESYCDDTISPVYNLQAHVAPLGLTFIDSPQFPEEWQGHLLVALHGSWNRSVPVGYSVVRLDVQDDKVIGEEDFITGFLPADSAGKPSAVAIGRPVDVEFGPDGSLYISDDKAGVVYVILSSS